MTQPRQIVAGKTYLITRRTLRRHHLFAPDPRIAELFKYSLAAAAERFEVRVHVANLMSTHPHIVATDTLGVLPQFLQFFHRLIALGTKVIRKWEGAVWDHEKTSVVELRTPQAVIERSAYAIVNPVAAGLVPRAKDWPGVSTRPDEIGRAVWRAERPTVWFAQDDAKWPPVMELHLTMPPSVRALGSDDEVRGMIASEVERQEDEARAAVRANGWTFLGRDRCEKLSPYRRARSWEPVRARNPTFAVGRGQRQAFFEAAETLRAFREAYREALAAWRAGDREVAFPPGTWLMRRLHQARTAEPIPTAA